MSLIKAAGAGEQSTGFYKLLLDQSLRVAYGDNPELTRTNTSAPTNNSKGTFSCWIKRGVLGSGTGNAQYIIHTGTGTSNDTHMDLKIGTTDQISIGAYSTTPFSGSAKFRDPSAWYHLVVAFDSTSATASDRQIKVYINGEETAGTKGAIAQNDQFPWINQSQEINIFRHVSVNRPYDGYIAEINMIDGTALTPASFGETKNGIWIPKDTSGLTFGTNGFHLTFKDDVVSEGFNTVTYTGTGATQSISGLGFSPDLVWGKSRSSAYNHEFYDVIRGTGNRLSSDNNYAEQVRNDNLQVFESDGFQVGTGVGLNDSGETYVGWCWEAGGTPTADNSASAGATPTAGSVKIDGSNLGSALAGTIPATRLSANTARGFSIVTWTGDGGQTTVAHGLGATPKIVIQKKRNGTSDWWFYTTAVDGSYDYLKLNATDAKSDYAQTAPTSTTFVSHGWGSDTMVAYCFAEISGYSSFGTYSGSGSSGKAVTGLGFKPAFLMVKRTDSTSNWAIYDNTRSTVDPRRKNVWANLTDEEYDNSAYDIDFDADGFTLRTSDSQRNASGGTYLYMAFADTREAAFFKDVSTNGNHFTPVNLDYRDSVPDVPTNNFATLNPLDNTGQTLSEGNLKFYNNASSHKGVRGNFGMASGKWYFECTMSSISSGDQQQFGLARQNVACPSNGSAGNTFMLYSSGGNPSNIYVYNNGTSLGVTAQSVTVGDVFKCAYDADTGKLWLGKNSDFYNSSGAVDGLANPETGTNPTMTLTETEPLVAWVHSYSNAGTFNICNFGQDSSFAGNKATSNSNADGNGHGSFAYAPPSGFLALCSQNLPEPAIIDGTEYFNTVLWTGNGSSASDTQAVSGVNFSPDFVWIKNRTDAAAHILNDSVRGAGKNIFSNTTAVENSGGSTGDLFTSFDSDGFTVNYQYAGTTNAGTNQNSKAYVAWNWLAGTAFSNDASATSVGTIDSSGQVNTKAGFSIISYTGTGSAGSIAHGLSSKPELIICKNRDTTDHWIIQSDIIGAATSGYYLTFTANAGASHSSLNTTLGSTTITLDTSATYNSSGNEHIMYAFHSVEGYCKIGTYTGSSALPFVYCGFKPAFLLIKSYSSALESWPIKDSVRSPNNESTIESYANLNQSEYDDEYSNADFLSNGFRLQSNNVHANVTGSTYVFLAFAEQPFKFSNAR